MKKKKIATNRSFVNLPASLQTSKTLLAVLKPTTPMQQRSRSTGSGIWTSEEHKLYLESLRFLRGSTWRERARFIGTRTERQVISHHQKYVRRLKRLRQNPHHKMQAREEHLVDPEILDIMICKDRRSQGKANQVIVADNETEDIDSLDEYAIDLEALLMSFDSTSDGEIQEFNDQLEMQSPHMQIAYDGFVHSNLTRVDVTAFERHLVGLETPLVVDDFII